METDLVFHAVTTIGDVAAYAGVGVGTVSRVLNGSPQVRQVTRQKVLDAVDALAYRPSRAGPRPSRSRPIVIGLIVPFFEQPSSFQRLRGVMAAVAPRGCEVVLRTVESAEAGRESIAQLPRHDHLDGLIVMSLPLSDQDGRRLAGARFPTVLLDTDHPALSSVGIDDRRGGELATIHLLDLGHRRIGFVGEPAQDGFGFVSSAWREKGFRGALAAHGVEVRPHDVLHGPHLRASGRQMAMELLSSPQPVSAVVATSDVQAIGVMDAARSLGRTVPGDLSVIGYDDIDLASYLGVTTVRQRLEESGRRAAEILLSAIATGERRVMREELDLELVVRSSTAPPRTAHEA